MSAHRKKWTGKRGGGGSRYNRVGLAKLVGFLALTGVVGVVVAPAFAEPVLGCPLGLDKGVFWVRSIATYTKHTKWFNPNLGRMEPLPAGWYSKKTAIPVRLGYGLSDRLDVGVSVPWESRKLRRKQGPDWVEKDDSGLGDIWVAAKCKFIYQAAPVQRHWAFGVAYRFDSAGDGKVKNGIGSGANAWRLGLLYHGQTGPAATDELCGHLTYEFGDTVRDIAGFGKSGYRNADRISYKLFAEKELSPKWGLVFGPSGWLQVDETEKPNGTGVGYRAYVHNVSAKLEYYPNGHENEHQRLVLGISLPHAAKNGFTANRVFKFGGMWTW